MPSTEQGLTGEALKWTQKAPDSLPQPAGPYLLQLLELIPEALHLLLQVLEFVLLHTQQHLGSWVSG